MADMDPSMLARTLYALEAHGRVRQSSSQVLPQCVAVSKKRIENCHKGRIRIASG
jgi:DNA-binding HxlR family transcriptional regulator